MNRLKTTRALCFFITASAILVLTQWMYNRTMRSIKTGTIGKINAVIKHDLDANISIWGASTALLNINPKLIADSLNISTFNMGINGTNIDQYNGLLKEYISYSKNSRFIIISVDIFGGLEKRNEFYELHNWLHHIENDNIYDCMSDIDYYTMFKAKYIPFYRISLFSKHSYPYFSKSIVSHDITYDFSNLGFMPEDLIMDTTQNDLSFLNVPINMAVFNKLKSSCLYAIKHKIQPIVIITPCYYTAIKKIKNANEFIQLINSLKTDNIIVYDFLNTDISKDFNNFKNTSHLNSIGADKFTNLLLNNIKSEYQ
jgi:hypothetical protein